MGARLDPTTESQNPLPFDRQNGKLPRRRCAVKKGRAILEFDNLAVVLTIAFLAPLCLGMVPELRVPAVVLEIVAGIVVGPSGFGWVEVDRTVAVFSTVGLVVLLFLAGIGIELERLRGRLLWLSIAGFGASVALGLAAAAAITATGVGEAMLLIGITLTGTSLAVIIPVLKDSGEASTALGQAIVAGSTITGFGAVLLLSLLFTQSARPATQILMIVLFAGCLAVTGLGIAEADHWRRLATTLQRLEDTSAQIRVRGTFLIIAAFVLLGERLGVEVVLGAFLAGLMVGMVDRDRHATHPHYRLKLDGIGYGVFIPVYFVASGLRFDLNALVDRPSAFAKVPVFLAALLVTRGLPAAVFWPMIGTRRAIGAALLQATSLPFIVLATQIGVSSGRMASGTAAAFVAAGLISVMVFPAAALMVLGQADAAREPAQPVPVNEGHAQARAGGAPST